MPADTTTRPRRPSVHCRCTKCRNLAMVRELGGPWWPVVPPVDEQQIALDFRPPPRDDTVTVRRRQGIEELSAPNRLYGVGWDGALYVIVPLGDRFRS